MRRVMRNGWRTLAAGILCTVACSSVDLPNGKSMRVVREVVPPTGKGAYVLIYRTASSPSDCPAIVPEMEEVWTAVRARANEAQAPIAAIVAEAGDGASTVAMFVRSEKGWKQSQRPWGCDAKGAL
jgi:hypothetical protein